MRTGIPDLRKEGGGRLKAKKRTPVALEKWFGPQKSKAESLGSGEKRGASEDCPAEKQGRKEGEQ